MEELNNIADAVVAGDIEGTKNMVNKALAKSIEPVEIINRGIVAALDVVGERFASAQIFLPEMLLSAVAAREGVAIATQGMQEGAYKPKATMVLGSVRALSGSPLVMGKVKILKMEESAAIMFFSAKTFFPYLTMCSCRDAIRVMFTNS